MFVVQSGDDHSGSLTEARVAGENSPSARQVVAEC